MPHEVGFVDDSEQLAHYAMLEKIRDFSEAHGWEVLHYDDTIANRELILKGKGYSGEEEIFVGFHTYQDETQDYYNLSVSGFTGYVPGNTFGDQPGRMWSGIPAHNQRIDYWLTVNPQRIALAMKVGTPVYTSAYTGKFLPYARPEQYPYPVVCAGMLNGNTSTRFSDTSYQMPYVGNRNNMRMYFNTGTWLTPRCYPWGNDRIAGTGESSSNMALRDTEGSFPLLPVELHDNSANIYGALDGIYYISGFDNVVENTLEIDGVEYVVIQNVHRTTHRDYYVLRLDN